MDKSDMASLVLAITGVLFGVFAGFLYLGTNESAAWWAFISVVWAGHVVLDILRR